ncbi:MAG: hypothetical protein LBL94_01975 [Prevotellaceae bacterium]|jgi:hypothetical protein|nr:hypothetical protein [Prevotellaceae bacterium]
MSKYPKFFVAKNPMAAPDSVYILHAQKPRFLAKLESNAFEVVDDIDTMVDYYKGNSDKVQGLFRAMEKWYVAYKVYENGRVHGKN